MEPVSYHGHKNVEVMSHCCYFHTSGLFCYGEEHFRNLPDNFGHLRAAQQAVKTELSLDKPERKTCYISKE